MSSSKVEDVVKTSLSYSSFIPAVFFPTVTLLHDVVTLRLTLPNILLTEKISLYK